MKLSNFAKIGTAALLVGTASAGFSHTTCDSKTHYTASYDYAPAPTVVVQRPAHVVYGPTLVAPAVPQFRTFRPFTPGVVILD